MKPFSQGRPITAHASRLTRHGFTLIEIMIVISIVAIIMATGIPAFVRAMHKDKLRKAVSDLVEGCSHARAQAILKGVPMELVIRAEDGHITVQPAQTASTDESFSSTESQADPSSVPAASAPASFSAQIPDNVAFKLIDVNFQDQMEQPETRVRFFANGTSDEFTVVIFSEEGERKISLDVVTGLSDVEVLR
jgi:prepilin-type N-terminal cleavage/methylation domain-containing protein